jgi:hypothetical protein
MTYSTAVRRETQKNAARERVKMSMCVFGTFIYPAYDRDCYSAHNYDVADNK